ncbi:DNA-binding protein YbiB [Massilia terrae]|uniref:DNA-binding protein YbiB n=1 Tax=Massilia terrae TaxID=1811224 RepID=A0ABT2CWT2_9BURK|nr:DNA-binding protein YbiB [Massilia terrae]MCS0658443.1 DNA-binding protein YbiB [Massilia terrae]
MQSDQQPFHTAHFIKEIGRGQKGARSITREDARQLYEAMLDGRVPDIELGALLLAMRIKGESVEELAGFMDAARASLRLLPAPSGAFAPVVLPSYNGSRKLPNLTPLLAGLLAREGVPVLVHGVSSDPGRITTAEIFAELGWVRVSSAAQMLGQFSQHKPCFMPIEALAPRMAAQLALRRVLGVRNSTHTLVKILQPFDGPALRLVSYTHPEYLELLGQYFSTAAPAGQGDAFLMRGTEGETVANPHRAQQIDWFHEGERTVLAERDAPTDELSALPEGRDAASTAQWIALALQGAAPVPASIAAQAAHCIRVARALASG